MTIALPSGRLFQPILNILQRSGYFGLVHYQEEKDRHLVFYNREGSIRFIITKPKDTSTYVECGVADMGIAGKDILLEKKKTSMNDWFLVWEVAVLYWLLLAPKKRY